MRNISLLFYGVSLILLTLLVEGCGQARPLNMSPQEIGSPTKEEGIVIGSVRMTGGWDMLGRKRWKLFACKNEQQASYVLSNPAGEEQYQLIIDRDGPEVFFVAKLPAGHYRFHRILGVDMIGIHVNLDTGFHIKPGEITYVGRLYLDWRGPTKQISMASTLKSSVIDAKKETLEHVEKEQGFSPRKVNTDLMDVRNAESNPQADAIFHL